MATIREAIQMAVGHHQAGRLPQAEQLYQEILRGDPQQPDALHLLGMVWYSQGKHETAIESIRRAVELQPGSALFLTNLGATYHAVGNLDDAVASYRQALQIKPGYAKAHYNLGNVFNSLGKLDESVACYQRALQIKSDYADAHYNLGKAFKSLGKLDESIACYQRALQIKPDYADAHFNLGNIFKSLGKLDDSIASFQRALQINPDYTEAHHCLGLILLSLGRFEEGWAEYEYRFESMGHEGTNLPFPRWDGRAPSTGESILLLSEQGLGDTLQFIRYATFLNQSRGFRVICAVQPVLLTILSTVSGIDQLVSNREPLPTADRWSHLLSLPELCGHHSPADFPVADSWVTADPGLAEHWRGKLSRYSGFRVGIAWQGNRKHKDDLCRSVALEQFAPVARLDGVTLISLQQGPGSEQLESVGQDLGVVSLGDDVDGAAGAFMDTAAIMKTLDLVISTDTAIVHLAGSLGVPVWVPLGIAPDWRWQLTGSTTPWYPSMRLFRQPKPGDWDSVFGQIVDELLKLEPSIQVV